MTAADGVPSRAGELRLRPVTRVDVPAVLALNERFVDLLAPMDEARLEQLAAWADRFDVLDLAGDFGGFVLTVAAGSDYDSENYRWFARQYGAAFYYLDRIVLDPSARRQGVATRAYDELERVARPYGRLCLEVNADPPNEPSLAFHRGRGFVEVGRQGEPGHEVALMVKQLDDPDA